MADRPYATQRGRPVVDKAFNGLKTITRISDINATGFTAANIDAEVMLAYGTADAEFVLALLVKRAMQQISVDNNAYVGRLTEVYQEFTAGQKVSVGEDQVIIYDDGRTGLVKSYVSLAGEAEGLAASAGTVLGSRACSGAQINKHGIGAEIIETYVSSGQIAQSDSTGEQGALLTRGITSVNTVPVTPAGYTLIRTDVNPVTGLPIYRYTFVRGNGLVAVSIAMRDDGLREETNVAYGTKSTPSGVVIRDDYREGDGYRIYTVTSMQAADGTSAAGASYSIEAYVPFTYPGRAKAFSEVYDGKTMLNLFKDPPVATQVRATVTVSYQTSNTLGTISDFWSPSQWACVRAQWVGSYGRQTSQIDALPGYRADSSTPVTFTGNGFDSSIFGGVIYNASTAKITVTGGPSDPGGTTKTLHASLDERPAFTSRAGVNYYRKTIVSASIPAQAALPV